jgi:hypothetical protein
VRGDDAIPLWIAPVDRGVARLEHFGAWIRERDFEASSRDSHWFLELGSLHAKLSAVPVDARTRGPVEFVLPPSGELEVEIVDADGTPVTPSEPVAIELASRATRTQSSTNEDGDTLMLTFAPAPGNASPRSLAIDGRALFRNLPLSQRFAVFVRRNAVSEACCIECIGPHRAGERSRARIELGHSTVTVSARLITPSGAPLSKACVQVAVQHDASKRMPEWVRSGSLVSFYQVGLAAPSPYCSVVSRTTTDGDGWLRVDLDPWTASSGAPYLVVESDTGLPSALGTRIPLARAWHVGATDLGDVALANPGILIAGRVVGSDGAPVSGVEFSWQWSWYTPALTAYSDASGIFAMSTSLSCDEVMPLIRRDGYAPVTLRDIASGSAGIEVVLRRAARVRGRLRAPDAAHRLGDDEPRVWLIQNGECEGRWPQCVSARLSTDGSFESESLGPGSWRLTIRQHEETREIDITAREGETLDVGEIELDGGR